MAITHALTSTRVKHHPRREEDVTQREWNSGHIPKQKKHESVLVEEIIRLLAPEDGEVAVDATAGQGGHSEALLKAARIRLFALDADPSAVEATRERLKRFGERVEVIEANFSNLAHVLNHAGVQKINLALFDLGWRSEQLSMGKGFSFLNDEPLNMSYGKKPASGFTASDILNTWDEKVIADVLFGYGEERYARRIAKAVNLRRKFAPITPTIEFVALIRDCFPPQYRHGKLHFATRSFQALRVAVNDELTCIEHGVRAAWEHLAPGGRIGVISFHSTEDRVVKRLFNSLKAHGELLTKKPVTASHAEITRNPSARSAKLRAIKKV